MKKTRKQEKWISTTTKRHRKKMQKKKLFSGERMAHWYGLIWRTKEWHSFSSMCEINRLQFGVETIYHIENGMFCVTKYFFGSHILVFIFIAFIFTTQNSLAKKNFFFFRFAIFFCSCFVIEKNVPSCLDFLLSLMFRKKELFVCMRRNLDAETFEVPRIFAENVIFVSETRKIKVEKNKMGKKKNVKNDKKICQEVRPIFSLSLQL